MLVPPPSVFAPWLQSVSTAIWISGLIAFGFGTAVTRLAKRQGWHMVGRLVPALVIAVLLMGLAVAESRGVFTRRILVNKQVYYAPYCEGIWWYLEPLCWGI